MFKRFRDGELSGVSHRNDVKAKKERLVNDTKYIMTTLSTISDMSLGMGIWLSKRITSSKKQKSKL